MPSLHCAHTTTLTHHRQPSRPQGAQFPLFSKVDVNGDSAHEVYRYLKKHLPGDIVRSSSDARSNHPPRGTRRGARRAPLLPLFLFGYRVALTRRWLVQSGWR